MVPTAIGCAVLFAVLNTGIIAVAAHVAEPETPLKKLFWDRESLLLDLTEICVGVLVAVTCALSFRCCSAWPCRRSSCCSAA